MKQQLGLKTKKLQVPKTITLPKLPAGKTNTEPQTREQKTILKGQNPKDRRQETQTKACLHE
jgi:hypothetical protein